MLSENLLEISLFGILVRQISDTILQQHLFHAVTSVFSLCTVRSFASREMIVESTPAGTRSCCWVKPSEALWSEEHILSIYFGPVTSIDSEIEEALELEDKLRATRDETELEKRLREKGLVERASQSTWTTIGRCIEGLTLIAEIGVPEDLRDQVIYLPL